MKRFYLNNIVFYIAGGAAVLFVISYFIPAFFEIAGLLLLLLVIAVVVDTILIYSKKKGMVASRDVSERFSIGDPNKVFIYVFNNYGFTVKASIIDELPAQFQERKWMRKIIVAGNEQYNLEYTVRPDTRGEYVFHDINVFVHGPLKLARRHYVFREEQVVKVYPSYIQMRRYQLLAVSNRLQEAGVKRIRKIGHSMEFEQIKEYVIGDDTVPLTGKLLPERMH